MKRKLTLPFIILLCSFGVYNTGCHNEKPVNEANLQAKGNVVYGGVFRINETEEFLSLLPIEINEVTGIRIAAQIFEGLVKFNQRDLSIMPALATSWEVLDNSSRYVFHLRRGVYFHDDLCFEAQDGKGRELNASDIKYCFDLLCTAAPFNRQYEATFKGRVVGAEECYTHKTSSVSGIKIINDSTIEIKLQRSMPGFINILATGGCWIFAKEAISKYGNSVGMHCVGTGPFVQKLIKNGESVVLQRNANYWKFDEWGNRLPYLDQLQFSFIKDKLKEVIAFRNGGLDMLYRLPHEMAKEVLGDVDKAKNRKDAFEVQSIEILNVTYYGFLTTQPPFDNKKVRQAFVYSIDRNFMAQKLLNGDVAPALNGFVPPCMDHYQAEKVKGFDYDPDKAKQLFSEAGYPQGKNFPEITLLIGAGKRNTIVADYISQQLKEILGVSIRIQQGAINNQVQEIESGKALFWRMTWYADYPDPEAFLSILYGGNLPDKLNEKSSFNTTRYNNSRFDSLFNAAVLEPDSLRRADLFRQADQCQVDDVPLMPLFYGRSDRLLKNYVRGFDINSLEFRDFSTVWFDQQQQNRPVD